MVKIVIIICSVMMRRKQFSFQICITWKSVHLFTEILLSFVSINQKIYNIFKMLGHGGGDFFYSKLFANYRSLDEN